MRQEQLKPYRSRVIGGAKGRVLEIGFGSGRNLPYYTSEANEVIGIDVSPEILVLARPAVENSSRKVRLITHTAESLPLDDKSFDTVVVTWVLCCIPDPVVALREARRVLKPGGQLRFVEHGLSPNPGVARWQNRLTPMWSYCAGGCHLNRKTDDLLRAAGFTLPELSTGYAPGLRAFSYMYEGTALST